MRISLILYICFCTHYLLAQIKIPVKIKIVDESLNNVDKAFIFINEEQVDCSYLNGIYLGKTNISDKYQIKIKHLSYSDFDTVIYSLDPIIDFKVDLVLKEYSIDEVEILSGKTLGMSRGFNLKDMYLHGNKILTLSSGKGENVLEVFNLEGLKEYEFIFESVNNYNKIHKGIKDHSLYLCSEKACQNFLINTIAKSISIGETTDKEIFLSKLDGVLHLDSISLYRTETYNFNTKSSLVKYELPNYERTVIYDINDTKTLNEIHYYFKTIIRIYNNFINKTSDPSSIHYQMIYPEIIGYPQKINEIIKFYIDDQQLPYINKLQSIELKNYGSYKLKDNRFLVIDNLTNSFLAYSKNDLQLVRKLKLPDGKKIKWNFISSHKDIYIEDNNSQIYRLNEQKNNWEKISTQFKGYYDVLSKFLVGDTLYILAREHINSNKNKIFVEKISIE